MSAMGHWRIMRVDHWIKNVFVLPGVIVALTVAPERLMVALIPRVLIGLLAIGLVASGNYVLNEVLDAPGDRAHPRKRLRPVAAGEIRAGPALVQWILLLAAGIGLGLVVSVAFAVTLLVLAVAGTLYNLPPIRTKDIPYIDVLSEAINNPLRMLAGWFLVGLGSVLIPVSLLVSYWMIGCYFMALKRYSELRQAADLAELRRYRPVFRFYSEPALLASIMCYASAAMLFLGAFIMRYRLELILAFPLVAIVMGLYMLLAFAPESPVQEPERLWREPRLVVAVALCTVAMLVLLFVDIPVLHEVFRPTLPVSGGR